MNCQVFEQLVAEALEELPDVFLERLDNVEVVIEDWPDPETLHRTGAVHPAQLLGAYHGVPQTRRDQGYGLVLPDKISIYQRPIEMACRSAADMRETVRRVVRHELAHHFGLDDDRLREIGAY
jgi:predicted Zn-dependent protease with MMP-like domain